jgi:hypothetical protein
MIFRRSSWAGHVSHCVALFQYRNLVSVSSSHPLSYPIWVSAIACIPASTICHHFTHRLTNRGSTPPSCAAARLLPLVFQIPTAFPTTLAPWVLYGTTNSGSTRNVFRHFLHFTRNTFITSSSQYLSGFPCLFIRPCFPHHTHFNHSIRFPISPNLDLYSLISTSNAKYHRHIPQLKISSANDKAPDRGWPSGAGPSSQFILSLNSSIGPNYLTNPTLNAPHLRVIQQDGVSATTGAEGVHPKARE